MKKTYTAPAIILRTIHFTSLMGNVGSIPVEEEQKKPFNSKMSFIGAYEEETE